MGRKAAKLAKNDRIREEISTSTVDSETVTVFDSNILTLGENRGRLRGGTSSDKNDACNFL